MQAPGALVAIRLAEFPPGVKDGHDDFRGGLAAFVHPHWHPPPMVLHRNGVVWFNRHVDLVTKTGQGFIDGVINDFVH